MTRFTMLTLYQVNLCFRLMIIHGDLSKICIGFLLRAITITEARASLEIVDRRSGIVPRDKYTLAKRLKEVFGHRYNIA